LLQKRRRSNVSDNESMGVTGEEVNNKEQECEEDLLRHKKLPTYSRESVKQMK
jgi:hypothetical protein